MISLEDKRTLIDLKEAIRIGKERIRRLQVLKKGKESDFWKALRAEIEFAIKGEEGKRDNQLWKDEVRDVASEYVQIKGNGKAIRAFKGVIFNVDSADGKIDRLNEEIAEYNRRIQQIEKGETKTEGRAIV